MLEVHIRERINLLKKEVLFEEVANLVLATIVAIDEGNEVEALQLILKAETKQEQFSKRYGEVKEQREYEPINLCSFCHEPVSGEFSLHSVCNKCYKRLTE